MTGALDHRRLGALRSITLSWMAVSISVLAHLLAGGAAPPVGLTLGLGAVLTVVSTPVVSRAFRIRTSGPLLIAQQLVVHVSLSLGGHPSTGAGQQVSMQGPHGAHLSGATGTVAASGHAGHGLLPSPGMLAAHVAAALIIATLLTHTEADLRRLHGIARALPRSVRRLTALLIACATPLLALPSAPAATLCPQRRALDPQPAGGAIGDLWRSPAPCRRGPPALHGA